MSKMIFLEPSFLISLFFQNKNHKKSKKIFKHFEDEKLVISWMVIAEVLTVLRKLKQTNIMLSMLIIVWSMIL